MDFLEASNDPPAGLSVEEVPLFVSFGFDDNGYSGLEHNGDFEGVVWVSKLFNSRTNPHSSQELVGDTFKGDMCRTSFFCSTIYLEEVCMDTPERVYNSWNRAFLDGHELGSHTHFHRDGATFLEEHWRADIGKSLKHIQKITGTNAMGFRAPFLSVNHDCFEALQTLETAYDCSLEEGWQDHHNGTNFYWPFTLHHSGEGYALLRKWHGYEKPAVGYYPGLWELPVYVVIAPPDSECEKYGIDKGFRDRLSAIADWFDAHTGKITGLDFNLWGLLKMSKEEFLATLKYTFDLRVEGNRAPFVFGAHSEIYCAEYEDAVFTTYEERQEAMEEFLEYVLSHDFVRVVNHGQVIEWCKKQNEQGIDSVYSKDETKSVPLILCGDVMEAGKPFHCSLSNSTIKIRNQEAITYKWFLDEKLVSTEESVDIIPPVEGESHMVRVEVKSPDRTYGDGIGVWKKMEGSKDELSAIKKIELIKPYDLGEKSSCSYSFQQGGKKIEKLYCAYHLYISAASGELDGEVTIAGKTYTLHGQTTLLHIIGIPVQFELHFDVSNKGVEACKITLFEELRGWRDDAAISMEHKNYQLLNTQTCSYALKSTNHFALEAHSFIEDDWDEVEVIITIDGEKEIKGYLEHKNIKHHFAGTENEIHLLDVDCYENEICLSVVLEDEGRCEMGWRLEPLY